MDNIFATCKVECQRKNIPATKLNAYNQFVNRVRQVRLISHIACSSRL